VGKAGGGLYCKSNNSAREAGEGEQGTVLPEAGVVRFVLVGCLLAVYSCRGVGIEDAYAIVVLHLVRRAWLYVLWVWRTYGAGNYNKRQAKGPLVADGCQAVLTRGGFGIVVGEADQGVKYGKAGGALHVVDGRRVGVAPLDLLPLLIVGRSSCACYQP